MTSTNRQVGGALQPTSSPNNRAVLIGKRNQLLILAP